MERKRSWLRNSRLRLQLLSWHGGCYWCRRFNWVTSTFMVMYMYDHRTNRTKMKPALELDFGCNCFHRTEDVIGIASSTELQVHSWLCTCMTIGQIERKWSPHWNCRLRLQLRSSHGGCYWCSKFNWVTSTFMVIYMYDHRTYRTKMKPLMELSTSVATLSSHGGCYLCTRLNWVSSTFMVIYMYDHRTNRT